MKFDFNEKHVLENERALLRPLEEKDLEHLEPFVVHEPETWQFSVIPIHDQESFQNYFCLALDAKKKGTEYPFIVFDKLAQKYAGSTRFYDIQLQNDSLQLGYTWYGKAFRGTGLNKHCKFLLLQFAFEKMGMLRVEFRADNGNKKSIAAMKSIGCTVEGVLRAHVPKPAGGRRDTIVLSILEKEWREKIKKELQAKLT